MPLVKCPYCGKDAVLTTGKRVYPDRPDLWDRQLYLCEPCEAWVGCHKNSDGKPLGRLANAQLRHMKVQAHHWFDQIWRGGYMTRKAAYQWLAGKLGIQTKHCHIGRFDEVKCAQVVRHCKRYMSEMKLAYRHGG